MLDKIQEANQYVVLRGQLVTYKDGSKGIDPDSIVRNFRAISLTHRSA
jgi:hypothetical protein